MWGRLADLVPECHAHFPPAAALLGLPLIGCTFRFNWNLLLWQLQQRFLQARFLPGRLQGLAVPSALRIAVTLQAP